MLEHSLILPCPGGTHLGEICASVESIHAASTFKTDAMPPAILSCRCAAYSPPPSPASDLARQD
jgi:hypothetical protein